MKMAAAARKRQALKRTPAEYSSLPAAKRSRTSQVPRGRSPRAQGLRTLQHQSLPRTVCHAIDTEVWFRGLLLELAQVPVTERRWATKDQVYDEALSWYLTRRPTSSPSVHRDACGPVQDITFWLDSRLLTQVRRLAARHTVKLAQVIEQALGEYVAQHIPASLLQFRQRTQQQASRLYARHHRSGRARPRTARARTARGR